MEYHHYPSYTEENLPATLTVPEVSEFLRIGRNSAYQLIRCGKIRSLKIGRQLRIPRQALLDYLADTG